MSENVTKSLKGYWAASDRVILVKLQGSPFDINIIQVYAPTADAKEEEIDHFYDSIDSVIRQCKRHEMNNLQLRVILMQKQDQAPRNKQ